MSAYPYSLQNLLSPVSTEEFFTKYYEKEYIHVKKKESFYQDLLTAEDIDYILNSNKLRFPSTNLVGGKLPKLDVSSFTRAESTIDATRMFKHYSEGYTIVLSGLHDEFYKLGMLCDHMLKYFNHRFQTNIYCTPKDSQGFDTHYDSHDVIILQVHGHKKWQIYNSPIELPLKGAQEFNKDHDYQPTLRTELMVEPGDFLYIPRGMMHNAHTEDESSIHITLGLLGTTYLDLLTDMLVQQAKSNKNLRQYLPAGYAFDTQAQQELKEVVAKVQSELQFADLSEQVVKGFRSNLLKNTRNKQLHQLQTIDALDSVSLENSFVVRDNVLYNLHNRQGKAVLHFNGYEHSFPEEARELLDAIFEKKAFTGTELPDDYDEESQLGMLKFLLKEGILEVKK